jgi:hypothetical protein
MKKWMLPRLRDPCPACLVVIVCDVTCELKKEQQQSWESIKGVWDTFRLCCSAVCLIVLLPYVWIKVLYRGKN